MPSFSQPVERGRDVGARLGRDALPVLGEIGEHREEHEAAHERERVVEAQRIKPEIDLVRPAIPRCRSTDAERIYSIRRNSASPP
jgi:hypothetical protein